MYSKSRETAIDVKGEEKKRKKKKKNGHWPGWTASSQVEGVSCSPSEKKEEDEEEKRQRLPPLYVCMYIYIYLYMYSFSTFYFYNNVTDRHSSDKFLVSTVPFIANVPSA